MTTIIIIIIIIIIIWVPIIKVWQYNINTLYLAEIIKSYEYNITVFVCTFAYPRFKIWGAKLEQNIVWQHL